MGPTAGMVKIIPFAGKRAIINGTQWEARLFMNLFLASRSPRRQDILHRLGLRFDTLVSPFEEIIPLRHPDPPALACHLASEKMCHLNAPDGNGIVITADTIVFLDDRVLGKPTDRRSAREMLELLAGRTHGVTTALCLCDLARNRQCCEAAVTRVTFTPIPDSLLNRYLDTEEWTDKAGAYGIQGQASLFTRSIEGCYFNVVGFPVNLFYGLIQQLGYDLDVFSPAESNHRG